MPTMVERVRAICKAKGIPVSQLEKDLGYANGYLNPKKAETIRKDRIAEIAQYLGVSFVCKLPFGAISAYVNHYSSPKREWNVGICLGWQIFNYRFIE